MDIFDKLKRFELDLVNPKVRKNVSRLNDLIADDFEEIGSSGSVYTKPDILDMLPQESDVCYQLYSFRFTALSSTTVLVKYTAEVEGVITHRSSIWIKNAELWQMLYHQSTVSENVI